MKTLTEQQRMLAEQNHNLIVSFIRRNHLDFDEVYGDLAETYCLAIASYDKTVGKLSTYIFVSLGNRLKNIYRVKSFEKTIPKDLIVPIDKPIAAMDDASTYADVIPDRNMGVEAEVQYRMGWEQIHKEFSPFELELLDNIMYKEQTQRNFAKKYHVSQTSYARWEKAVKEKARRILRDALN